MFSHIVNSRDGARTEFIGDDLYNGRVGKVNVKPSSCYYERKRKQALGDFSVTASDRRKHGVVRTGSVHLFD